MLVETRECNKCGLSTKDKYDIGNWIQIESETQILFVQYGKRDKKGCGTTKIYKRVDCDSDDFKAYTLDFCSKKCLFSFFDESFE